MLRETSLETSMNRQEMMRIVIKMICLCGLLAGSASCSVYMAANQPKAKDLSVLESGTHRSRVIAELGAPAWSGEKDGNKVDVFAFRDGYSTANRTARALFHGVSDFFTLGLWEVIGTPTEAIFSGDEMKVEIAYGPDDRVTKTTNLLETGKAEKKAEPSGPPRKDDDSVAIADQDQGAGAK
jgi:hypothetical protein